jgi:hypothetical protein
VKLKRTIRRGEIVTDITSYYGHCWNQKQTDAERLVLVRQLIGALANLWLNGYLKLKHVSRFECGFAVAGTLTTNEKGAAPAAFSCTTESKRGHAWTRSDGIVADHRGKVVNPRAGSRWLFCTPLGELAQPPGIWPDLRCVVAQWSKRLANAGNLGEATHIGSRALDPHGEC